MEQILVVLRPYLMTVRFGIDACRTAPKRPIVGWTNDRSVM